jgi:hypothetical protein
VKNPAFISYARKDSDFALRLAGDLKAKGANVWLDRLDIRPGQKWDAEVERALNACGEVLVILSPTSVESPNVMDEVAFALDEGKTVIPVLYADCKIPLRLRRLQYVDFRRDYNRGLEALLKELAPGEKAAAGAAVAAQGLGPPPEPLPKAPAPVPRREPPKADEWWRRLSMPVWVPAGAAAIALALGSAKVYHWYQRRNGTTHLATATPVSVPPATVVPTGPSKTEPDVGRTKATEPKRPAPDFDAGADWQTLPGFSHPVSAIEVYAGRLFVATFKDGIYRLDDTSRKWQDVSDTARGRAVLTLHSVGVNLYAGYDSYGTQQSGLAVFSMDKWIDIGLTNWLVHAMANLGSRLHVGGYGGYFTAINPATVGGLGAIVAGLPPNPAINALEIVSGSVFAGLGPTQAGQRDTLFVLSREGTHWSNVPAVVDQDIHCLAASGDYLLLGTTTGVGRLNTIDMRFAAESNGLPENYTVQALAVNGNKIFAGLDGGGVWVSTDAGENWASLNSPELRDEAVLSLKVRNGSDVYVGTRSGKVFVLAKGRERYNRP